MKCKVRLEDMLPKERKTYLLRKQNNKCPICKNKFKNSFDICQDHCHITGKPRAILCRSCNSALAMLRENPIAAEGVLKYTKQCVDLLNKSIILKNKEASFYRKNKETSFYRI